MATWTREKVLEYCNMMAEMRIKERKEKLKEEKRKERVEKIKILFG